MNKNDALQEVAALSKGITHDAGQLLDLLGTAAWQAPIPGTDKYVVAGTLAMIGAAAAGTPITPASADNPSTAGAATIDTPEFRELLKQMRLWSHDHPVFSQIEVEIIAHVERLLAAFAAQATTPTAAEVRDQALEEAAQAMTQVPMWSNCSILISDAQATIRALRTASKDQSSAQGEKGGDDA